MDKVPARSSPLLPRFPDVQSGIPSTRKRNTFLRMLARLPGFLLAIGFYVTHAHSSPAEFRPPDAQQRTLFVAVDGKPENDGLTPESALPVQEAADRSRPGNSIYFTEGEYIAKGGTTLLTIARSGAPGKPITYSPAPGAKAILRNIDAWEAIKITGASHVVIRGFRVIGNAASITMQEARVAMSNLENSRTCGNGIGITEAPDTNAPASHIVIRDCVVSDMPGGGIFANHSDYLTIENNTVYRCAFWSPFGNSGISVYQPAAVDASTDYKIFIRNNVCFENYQNIPFYFSNVGDPSKRKVTDGNGIILDDFQHTQEWGGGTGRGYAGRTLVANNVVFANGGSGIHSFKSSNIDFVQNYAADNNRHPELRDGQIFANGTRHSRIINNVLIAPPGKPVTSSHGNENLVFENNLLATTNDSPPDVPAEKSLNIITGPGLTLIGWADGGRTFKAAPDSPLREAGQPFPEAAEDFFGMPRGSSAPDIGPFVLPSR